MLVYFPGILGRLGGVLVLLLLLLYIYTHIICVRPPAEERFTQNFARWTATKARFRAAVQSCELRSLRSMFVSILVFGTGANQLLPRGYQWTTLHCL